MKKVSYKILFGFLGVSVISLIILVLISFRTTKDNLNTAMNEKVLSSVEYYSNTIEKEIQGIQNYLDALNMLLKFDLDRKISEGDTLIKNKLELLTKEYNLEAAYLYLKPEYFGKEHVFNYEKSLGVYSRLGGGDRTDTLVKKFLNDPAIKTINYWTKPEYIEILNRSVIYCLEKLYIEDELVGAYGIAFDFERLRNDLENQSFYKEGRIFLLNQDYDYVYMSRSETEQYFLDLEDPLLIRTMREIAPGDSHIIENYKFYGDEGRMIIHKLRNGWVIVGILDTYKFLTLLNRAVIILGIVLIVIVLFLIIVSFSVAHEVVQPVSEIVEDLEGVAKGNLRIRTQVKGSPDVRGLATNLNKFLEKFEETLNNIKNTTNYISDFSRDILFSNKKFESKTLEQSNAIRNAYRISEGIKGINKMNTEKIGKLREVTKNTGNMISEIETMSHGLKNTIDGISSSSKKINTILDIIDELAFQTNLLSLNATVEAAKSGQQSKGFAVVASEIRNLAAKSSEASREIKSQINYNIGVVQEERDTLNDTLLKLEDMVLDIKKVEEIIESMKNKSSDQDVEVERIKNSIDEIEKVSRLTVQIAESNSKLVDQLFKETGRFLEMIDYFEGR